jgi:hypothetical protein
MRVAHVLESDGYGALYLIVRPSDLIGWFRVLGFMILGFKNLPGILRSALRLCGNGNNNFVSKRL